jgi:3-phosphoshikimate 1-carboxyvinyltransferase
MARVIKPLQMMSADIYGRNDSRFAPLVVRGGGLQGIEYRLQVASAQVKSAILLAALQAKGETLIYERLPSRDHTERMLSQMGVNMDLHKNLIRVQGPCDLYPAEWVIPGDISSAAFWMVAATIIPGSEILVRDVGINPTRAGILEVLQSMGAEISLQDRRVVGGEPLANILIRHYELQPVELMRNIIPSLIDEIPILAIAMAMATGTSVVRDASELRAKESDRITMIVSSLSRMGVNVEETEDGFVVHGIGRIPGNSQVSSGGDHRMAMSSAIAGLASEMPVTVEGFDCVAISYPTFLEDLNHLAR